MRIVIPNQPAGTNLIIKARSKSGDTYSDWSRNFYVTTAGDTVAPKTPANVAGSMAGTSFILKWDAVTQSSDNTAASDLAKYEVKISSSQSANTNLFSTADTKFEFPLAQNIATFGGPKSNVQMAVRAIDSAGNASAWSTTVSQTNPAPAAPTGLTGASGADSLDFSWNAVADADLSTYRLYSGTTAGTQGTLAWSGSATRVTIQTIDYVTPKYFKVVAVDVFGTESATSNVVGPLKPNNPNLVDTTPPAVPTNLAGTLTNAADGKTASMAVTWTGVSDNDLDSYVVAFRQTATPVNDWQYVNVSRDATSTTIQGLVPYAAHDIRIRAKDFSANYSAYTSIVNVTAQANTAPAVPSGLSMTAGKDNVQITWNENTELDMKNNAGTYDVTVATNSGFTTGVLQYRTGNTTLAVNGLASNTTYYARVRATDSAGLSSAYSASVNKTTSNFSGGSDGAVPTGAVTLSGSAGIGYIYLSWTPLANNDPVIYDVYMSTTLNFTTYDATTKITEVSGTSAFIDTVVGGASLAYGTTYYFKVRARDKDGSSASISNQVGVTPVQATTADLTQSINDTINNLVDNTPERINLASDPAATKNSQSNGILLWSPNWYGSGGSGNTTVSTGITGPVPEITTALRKTWTVAGGSGDTGFSHANKGTAAGFPVKPGQTITTSAYFRAGGSAGQKNANMRVFFYDTAGTQVSYTNGPVVNINSTTWTRASQTFTVPANIVSASIWSDVGSAGGWVAGDWAEGTGLLVEYGNQLLPYFDGNTANTTSRVYSWSSQVNNSQAKSTQASIATLAKIAESTDAVNYNPFFSAWAGAYPDGYGNWSSTAAPTKENSLVRTGLNAVRFTCADANDRGISIPSSTSTTSTLAPLPLNLNYVTVSMDVMLVSGGFGGAGLLVDWQGISSGGGQYRNSIDLNAEIPNPITGKWYRVTKVLSKPSGTSPQTGWGGYLMANYQYVGVNGSSVTKVAKDIIFDSLSFRPSTTEEISAFNAAPVAMVTDLSNQVNSKGTDLVTNGTGLLGNNYNFSLFNFNGSDAPVGSNGSFVTKTSASASHVIDELIPFDPFKKYKFSFQARQTVTGLKNAMYGLIAPYDAFGNQIYPYYYMYVSGTTTTLAADLKPGDTTVTLTDATNWYGSTAKPAGTATYLRGIIAWNYIDPNGRAWGQSYSRNYWANLWDDGGVSGNVITLKAPWPASNGTVAAGTSISNSSSGGNFIYMPSATNVVVPEAWTAYTDTYNGVGILPAASQAVSSTGAAGWNTGVPAATAKIKIGWLLNYNYSNASKHAIAAVSFSDAQAAQATADASSMTYIQSTAPVGRSQDLWIDTTGGANTPKRWNGSAWVAVTDKAATDAATAATNSSMTYIQSTAPAGRSQDLWIDTTGGANTPKRWNGSAWVAVTDQAAISAAQNYTDNKFAASLKNTVVEYAVNSSETVAPTTGWSTATPTRTAGTFVWYRTTLTFGDNTTSTSNPALLTGNTGATGSQGVPGPKGADGTSLYTWIKYADTPTTGMSDSPTGKAYMGIAYNKTTATESSTYSDYEWTLVKGADGAQGIQGPAGANGQPTYTWVKYGTDANGAGMSDDPTGKSYIGLAYNKLTQTESTTATDYQWSLILGPQGPTGATGATGPAGTPAPVISLTATSQILSVPATGGATNPTTTTVTGTALNTTISVYTYSVDGGAFSATVPAGVSRSGNTVTITGSTMTARTIAVRMADANGIADTLTVAKVSDGATGATGAQGPTGSTGSTGAAGADAYTVILTNEAQVFAGSTSAANAGSATTQVIAYKGTTQQSATIGTITGQVTGLTTAITNNGTNNPTVTVSVTTALTTQSGTLTIPVTVGGVSFTKTFAWSVSYTGATGATGSQGIQGPKGADGSTLYTWIKYADTPTTGMSDSPTGKTYMGIAYNKSSSTESTVYTDYDWSLIKGTDGATGAQGIQGPAGANGQPTYTWIKYGTSSTGAGLSDDPTGKTYIGIAYNKLTATESTVATDYEWSLIQGPQGPTGNTGPTGATGATGVGISSITPYFYQVSPSTGAAPAAPTASPPPAPWTATEPNYTANTALYRTERIVYTNSTFAYTAVYRSSSYDAAAQAQTTADGKNKIMRSTSDATGSNFTDGDLWWKIDANGNVVKQWKFVNGSGWVVETLMDGVLGSLNANKIVAGTTFTQDLYVKSNFTLGDSTTPGVIKSYDYSGTAGFSLSSAGLVINSGTIDAKTIKSGSSFTTNLFIGSGGAIQSTGYVAGSTGFKLSNTGLTIEGSGNTVSASVLKGGTITGTTVNIGAGGVLNVDSTASIKSNNYASGSTGYSLGSAGLEVNDGTIDAKTLKAGSAIINNLVVGRNADAAGTVQSYDYASGSAGWKIGKGLFEINKGTVRAAALQIQDSDNVLPPAMAGFEFTPSYYTNNITGGSSNVTYNVMNGDAKFGTQYLRITGVVAGSYFGYLGSSTADYNFPLEPNTTYILSGYVRSNTTAIPNASLRVRVQDGTGVAFTGLPSPLTTSWQRISGTFTTPANTTAGQIGFRHDFAAAGDYVEYDGIQVERQMAGIGTPSPWTPPGITSIDAGVLRTGEIRSNSTVTVNGVTQPAWSINMAGGAQFGNANIRGSLIVGASGADTDAGQSFIASGNFSTGSTGWKLSSTGDLEANTGTFRGTIIAGPQNNTHAEMGSTGFTTWAPNPAYPDPSDPTVPPVIKVVSLGDPNSSDIIAVQSTSGEIVGGIDSTGKVSAYGANLDATVYDANNNPLSGVSIYGRDFSDWINSMPWGAVASAEYDQLWSPPDLYSVEIGMGELAFDYVAGRNYQIWVNGIRGQFNNTGPNQLIQRIRYTIDGTAPTVNSPVLDSIMHDSTTTLVKTLPPMIWQGQINATQSGTMRILVTLGVYSGTGHWLSRYPAANDNAHHPMFLVVNDMGLDVPDVWQYSEGGSKYPANSTSTSTTTAKKNYVSTWTSTSSTTYRGINAPVRTDTSSVWQGYSSSGSYNGDQRGIWIFPDMTATLSGATVTKVEVYLYANHWYNNAGGTALIKAHGYTSAPSTLPSLTSAVTSASWPNPGGRWVTLPSSMYAGFKSGTYRGVGVGPAGSTSTTYYGGFNGGNGAQIRVSYTK